ncbi:MULTISPECIES: capsule synthesis positive regulator AcpB [unclassified Bacillus cereus group]|uniref:capsule synthesis positive regulator AcpB n=1 Tax=Bacillus cereus group TaxID=86661 RepID=UPI001F55CA89
MEKDIKRQIQILEIITSEKKWFTTVEISKILNCCNKTIMKDISFIKDFLPEDWHIKTKKGKGVRIYLPYNKHRNEITSLLFRESLTFRILQHLFEGETKTIVTLAERLYIQVPSILPALKRVENYLKNFGLKLSKKPLRLEGDEVQIMIMYFDLYLKSYNDTEWPFEGLKKEVIFQYLGTLEESLGISLHMVSKTHISFFIAILLTRKQQGYKVQLNRKFLYFNTETPYYIKIEEISKQLESKFGVSLTVQDKILLTISIKSAKYVYKDIDKEKEESVQYFKQGNLSVYELVKDFINSLEEKLKVDLINDEEFIFALVDYFKRTVYYLQYLCMFERPQKQTIQYMQTEHPETFSAVKEVYTECVKKNEIADYVPVEEIAKVTMYIEVSKLRYTSNYKRALLVTGESESWAEYLSATLTKRFGDKIQISTVFCAKKSDHDISADFIISTIPLDLDSTPIICINSIPTERDYTNIQYYLDL